MKHERSPQSIEWNWEAVEAGGGALPIRGANTPSPGLLPGVLLPLLVAASIGCSSGRVLDSANNWAYHTARYNEDCYAASPTCECRHEALARWRKLLDEANEAAQRGGKYPLQLRALKDAEAKLGGCR
jgi:hypothetical protein